MPGLLRWKFKINVRLRMRRQLKERSAAEAWKLRQTSFFLTPYSRFMRASLPATFIDAVVGKRIPSAVYVALALMEN